MSRELISKVWQVQGLVGKVVAGALVFKKEQVTYITEEGIQFSVPLAELKQIKWPFLRMGLGFDTVVNDRKYKFSFSKPNPSAPEINISRGSPFPNIVSAGQYFDDVSSLLDLKSDKATAKMWKEILKQND